MPIKISFYLLQIYSGESHYRTQLEAKNENKILGEKLISFCLRLFPPTLILIKSTSNSIRKYFVNYYRVKFWLNLSIRFQFKFVI